MNREGSILTIAAAVFLSWFAFRRSLNEKKNKNKNKEETISNVNNTASASDSSPSPSASTSASASASTSDTLLFGEYEVFLSFYGKDTRKGFTDFLYTYLDGAGIRTFRDNECLHVGEEIGPELLKAINSSKISIPVFSKHYASSKWCMLELAQMAQCQKKGGQKIIPIFYDVDPYEVRHQSGSYKEAFCQHRKKRFDEKTVQGWKDALAKVGQLKGLELKKETDGREGQLVKKIVEMVLLKLEKNYTPVPDNVVGMDEHIKEMDVKLNVDSDGVRIVGIHGMGGLGKTTIAKVIYNSHCQRFKYCCFLDDVRENSQHNGIVNLQNQLLSKIQNTNITNIANKDEGIIRIKDAIHGKKVFIVLDDVEEKSQYDLLVGSSDWFASGSRIIVTTRNKLVLDSLKEVNVQKGLLGVFEFYEPPFMKFDVSLQLFSKCAFMRDYPNEGYSSLAEKFVLVAAGLPLVLETIGSLLLVEKDKALWEEKLRELQEIPDIDVQHRLKISFNALTSEQQQIFLDIACLFIGHDKINPCYMWDDCRFHPSWALNVLVQRSLIKIGDDNTFKMHDQQRDLGRYIVREGNLGNPGRWSRLWNMDEALAAYNSGQGSEIVEALRLVPDLPWWRNLQWKNYVAEKFVRLRNLRYLSLDGARLDGDFEGCLPNLRWLQVRKLEFTATNFHLRNIVILHLSSSFGLNVRDGWDNLWTEIQMSKKLKVLNLSGIRNLRSVPSGSSFSKLERLVVGGCDNLTSLDGIEELESLRYLQASICYGLKTLPNLSRLINLEELDLSYCYRIEEILGLDKLESLEHLKMSGCTCLKRLPDLSNLKRLKALDVSKCCALIEIQGLEGLESLERLDMSSCKSIKRLSDLSNLKRLKALNASRCWALIEIQGLEGLESLEELNMNRCTSIKRLSDLSNLKRLKALYVSECRALIEIQGLEGLESLEELNMNHCTSTKRLSDLSNLKRLKALNVSFCWALIEIQGLEGLESLEELNMCCCDSIKRLPDLSNLKRLKALDVSFCRALIEIQGLEGLESLEELNMNCCRSIKRLSDLSNLKRLKALDVSECCALIEIQGLEGLESLEQLDMNDCKSIELVEIRGLEELKSLVVLSMNRCKLIESLPDISSLMKLSRLEVHGCKKLTEIRGLDKLESLEDLDIGCCKSFESLPDISSLVKLRDLRVSGCEKLTEIPGLEELKSLEYLNIGRCKSFESLPDISSLVKLRRLKVCGCEKLTEIPGLEELKSLEYLNIGRCKLFESLPDFSNLKKLETIVVTYCERLTEIRGLHKLESLHLFIHGCISLKNLPSSKDITIHENYFDEGDTCSFDDCNALEDTFSLDDCDDDGDTCSFDDCNALEDTFSLDDCDDDEL